MSSLTVEDSESSFLKGKAEFDKWLREFETNWYMPQIEDLLGVMVNMMPMQSRLMAPLETSAAELAYRKMRGQG